MLSIFRAFRLRKVVVRDKFGVTVLKHEHTKLISNNYRLMGLMGVFMVATREGLIYLVKV